MAIATIYDHQSIEKKWRKIWGEKLTSGESKWLFDEKIATESDDVLKRKLYLLDMFPYPSGSGLHVGHVEQKTALDIYARMKRMQRYNVLFPTGYDSFGLPTENYAIKNNISPQLATAQSTARFRDQTENLGISYDWSRELAASDPSYYKFTQWWFKFLYERGLAYRKKQIVNWCPKDQTVLANEQVLDGKCERCDTEVVQKNIEQWFFKITDYADRLLSDLDKLDWPESTKMGQRNWIGRSEGIEIDYLVPRFQKVVVGTTNHTKIERIKRFVELYKLGIEVLSPEEVGIEDLKIEESGDSLVEIAKQKALAYSRHTDLPVISVDGGLESNEVKLEVGTKAQALAHYKKVNGRKSEYEYSKEEIAEAMIDYFKGLAAERKSGSFEAYFVDGIVLAQKGEIVGDSISKRPLTIHSTSSQKIELDTPLNSIYKAKGWEKYGSEMSREERDEFIKPIFEALKKVLTVKITVFTTRPDTNFGATFVAVAPDSSFIQEHLDIIPTEKKSICNTYINETPKKTDKERQIEGKKKTGAFTGLYAVNQLNGVKMPIWISDFVLGYVGTGALVGVPGHDMRDFLFAQEMGISIKRVVVGPDGDTSDIVNPEQVQEKEGKMINSGFLDGLEIMDAKSKIMDYLEKEGWGRRRVTYKLRDWSISRQRYWGAPIPMLYRDLRPADQSLLEKYSDLPYLVLNLHAYQSSAKKHYHPWIDRNLATLGIKSITPELSGDVYPELQTWVEESKQALTETGSRIEDFQDKDNNLVITGRSMGSWAALKLAEDTKVRKLILVCPISPASLAKEIDDDSAGTSNLTKEQLDMFKKYIGEGGQGNLDIKKIRKNVSEIVIFLSVDDPYIPVAETETWFRQNFPAVRVITLRDSGHFTEDRGYKEFKGLFDEITKPVRLDLIPVRDEELPVMLPEDADYRPQGTAPLGTSKTFDASIPKEHYPEEVRREIDTMDTFVCSSWYFFRFLDSDNAVEFATKAKLNKFGPVDFYMGGAEHTVLHLLYARFFTKVAFDAGLIDYDEPFTKLRHQGLILGPDNRKMSKRWGNIIDPNDIVEHYGADTIRMYEMFVGPLDAMKPWNDGGVKGVRRFLQRVWDTAHYLDEKGFTDKSNSNANLVRLRLNSLVDSTGWSIDNLAFNTAVSDFMKFINFLQEQENKIDEEAWKIFLQLLYPFAPFLASELWTGSSSVEDSSWPEKIDADESGKQLVTVVVMVNGKLRDKMEVEKGSDEATLLDMARKSPKVSIHLGDREIKKKIFVQDKVLNLVV